MNPELCLPGGGYVRNNDGTVVIGGFTVWQQGERVPLDAQLEFDGEDLEAIIDFILSERLVGQKARVDTKVGRLRHALNDSRKGDHYDFSMLEAAVVNMIGGRDEQDSRP